MGILTYYDCKLNGRPALFWPFFVFITCGLGYIVYVIKAPDRDKLAAAKNRGKRFAEQIISPVFHTRDEIREKELSPFPQLSYDYQFSDKELDSLISGGDIPGAKQYLEGILKIAEETQDHQTLNKYRRYVEDLSSRS
jgi:hypothetical protein